MNIQEQHTASAQELGYVYQLYYFVLLSLELKLGEKIGFEVKDDIHIDKGDDTTVLFQAKHTIYDNQNLTTLDVDLWKTLSNWADFIKSGDKNFLDKHSFVLVTNKNEESNEFIDTLHSQNIDTILSKLKELKDRTKDETIKQYINNVISLGKQRIKQFISKLSIEIVDDIIIKIKNKIIEKTYQSNLGDAIFDNLYSNIQQAKYFDTRSIKKFERTYEDLAKLFERCFKPAFENKPLPKRRLDVSLPDDLESQVFIRQLIDIGDIDSGSKDIIQYTTQMLKVLNHFDYWLSESFVSYTEMESFEDNSFLKWENKFKAQYRPIRDKIKAGTSITELEDEIKELGVQIIDYIREQDLNFQGYPTLEREFSNGHYYVLSDKLKIGWHYDWENKYKKK
jgi:hypothetical protein